jgi:hypothetical protein
MLPNIMIALSILAAIVYACHGDVRKTGYWAAAALLNICVTY